MSHVEGNLYKMICNCTPCVYLIESMWLLLIVCNNQRPEKVKIKADDKDCCHDARDLLSSCNYMNDTTFTLHSNDSTGLDLIYVFVSFILNYVMYSKYHHHYRHGQVYGVNITGKLE